ncbi:MAG TPA: DegT/DnrJ/EryC1/StrS family aminotransferase [Desulfomonilaceae bacterium]|nr:DegT/DnrJ/EryC1/StrS family aminotransferase [Desulfomonilaceae bacterium]
MPGYEWIGETEKDQINEVLDTGILFRYEFKNERKGIYKVKEFEERFAHYTGAVYSHAVTSGSAALKVALAALGVGPGDEVITQGFTFIATFEAIIEAGAVPIPAEIDDTLNMDPQDFERKITEKTRAVIPVHMLGSPARIQEIINIARKHNILVIEDTAQALGAAVGGKKLGTWGDMGTFSFDFYKTITTGEGGMIITNDRELYTRASEYADHGHDHNPDVGRAMEGRNFLGFNYRMNELQGAIGLAQLMKLEDMIQRQQQNQALIRETLESCEGITMRALPDNGRDSYSHVCFFLPDGEKAVAFHKAITSKGLAAIYFKNNFWHFLSNWEHVIGKKTAWPGPFPFGGPVYGKNMTYSADMIPQTTAILEKLVVIPVFLQMDEELIQRIVMELQATAEEIL